jgi:hypothetical protein
LWGFVGVGGDQPGIAPPASNLTITTNDMGSVFTNGTYFAAGEQVEIIVIPDAGFYLTSYSASTGILQTENSTLFTFVMPNTSATLTFLFSRSQPYLDHIGESAPTGRMPIMTIRDFTENNIMQSDIHPNFRFVRGEVIVIAHRYVSYNEMRTLAEYHSGAIVGFLEAPNTYQLYFENAVTESELNDLVYFFNNHGLVVMATVNGVNEIGYRRPRAWMPTLDAIDDHVNIQELYQRSPLTFTPAEYAPPFFIPNDLLWADSWAYYGSHYIGGLNWGVHAINAPHAWYFRDQMTNVNVGIIDGMFASHEDLNITLFENNLPETIQNPSSLIRDIHHGTHVAGIIGAEFDNGIGIAGVAPNSTLFGYSHRGASTTIPQLINTSRFGTKHALATLFANNARLINISMARHIDGLAGSNFDITGRYGYISERDALTVFLRTYLERGHEFLIVQAAGNASNQFIQQQDLEAFRPWVDARYSGIFVNIEDEDIYSRIIVVGNISHTIELGYDIASSVVGPVSPTRFSVHYQSQIGDRVDIFAPGTEILSTTFVSPSFQFDLDHQGIHYALDTGTSMAAPHVTGVAAMVWGINPDLTGAQVKDIIVNRATHDDITVNVNVLGDIQVFPVLCALSSVEYVVAGVEGEAQHSRGCNTIFGMVRLYEEQGSFENYDIPAQIEIYRLGSDNQIERVYYAVVNNETVPTPILRTREISQESTIQGTIRVIHANTFEITLPVGMYMLRVSDIEGRQTAYTSWLNLNAPVPFQIMELQPGADIVVMVDGVKVITYPVSFLYPRPIAERDRVLVPIRPIAATMGFEVMWREEERSVALYSDSNTRVVMPINGEEFRVYDLENNTVTMHRFYDNVPPQLIGDRTFLPIRSLVGALGGFDIEIEWDNYNSRTILITSQPAFTAFGAASVDTHPILRYYQAGSAEWR